MRVNGVHVGGVGVDWGLLDVTYSDDPIAIGVRAAGDTSRGDAWTCEGFTVGRVEMTAEVKMLPAARRFARRIAPRMYEGNRHERRRQAAQARRR